MHRLTVGIVSLLLAAAVPASAQLASDNTRISGHAFGDYYWIGANHDGSLEGLNGFWFRRIYLTYDRDAGDAFAMRLRLEMAHPGDFVTSSLAEPFVKDAYLKWKSGDTGLVLGISPTPTWGFVEGFWGYRSVEKTPLDLQRLGSSRDFGVALTGKLGETGIVTYHLMAGNGNSGRSETNEGKKVMAAIALHPAEGFTLELYGDWNGLPGDNDRSTAQVFAAYENGRGRAGLLLAHQTRRVDVANDVDLQTGSIFVAARVAERVNVFARADRMFDPNPDGGKISYIPFDPTAKSTFLLAGVDFVPSEGVHLIPNIEVVVYDENGTGITPDTDVIPRVTFFYKF